MTDVDHFAAAERMLKAATETVVPAVVNNLLLSANTHAQLTNAVQSAALREQLEVRSGGDPR